MSIKLLTVTIFLRYFIFATSDDFFSANSSSYMLTDDDDTSQGEIDAMITSAAPSRKPSTVPSKRPFNQNPSVSPSWKNTAVPSAPTCLVSKTPTTRPTFKLQAQTAAPTSLIFNFSGIISSDVFSVKVVRYPVNDDTNSGGGGSRSKASPTYSPVPSVRPTTAKPTKTESPVNPISKSILKTTISPSVNPSFRSTASPSTKPTAKPTKSPLEDISYHGGLVMTGTVNAYNIYYGDISSSTKNLMNYFAANLGNTSWYNTLTTYYQIVNGVKTSVSKSLVYKNSVDVTATKTMLRGSDVINIILTLFNAGKFPVDSNGVYTLFFRGDISALYEYETPALNWLVDFCGYHGAFRITNGPIIKFMVIGDPSYAGANGEQCEQIRFSDPGGTANNNLGADSMVSVYAHEMAETITNYNGAWYFNSNGNENGDACYWDFGDYSGNSNMVAGTKRFLVQQMWVPTKGCVMSL